MKTGRSANITFCVTFHIFSCLILACLLCCSRLMSGFFAAFWLGICVEVDVWVINSIEFAGTQEVLKVKQKARKSSGKGNKPNASRSLTDSEVDELYREGQLGSKTPEAMLNTLWFNNTTYFGMGGRAGGEVQNTGTFAGEIFS